MLKIEIFLRAIERVAAIAVAILVVIIMAIVIGQLVDRHFVDLPWDAPDQYARIAIVWLCFLGSALAISDGTSIRIDFIDHVLPARLIAWRDALFDAGLLALLVLLVVKSWTVVKVGGSQILLGTPFTADLPYSGLFVGSIVAALFIGARLLRRIVQAVRQPEG